MAKKSVSIIIPNYNGAKLLQKNLPEVIKSAGRYCADTEVIVVDDCSVDESETVLQNFHGISVFKTAKNAGFSTACNLGIKKAKGEIVVLLNTDIVPARNFLEPLVAHFSDPSVFAVGCLDISREKNGIVERGRGIGTFKNGFLIHARGETNREDTLWVSGGSAAFSRSKWQNLEGFDEAYNPFYWEDIDLSYRAQKLGWKVLFERKSVVNHQHDSGSIKSNFRYSHIEAIAFRNQIVFMWKNITDWDLFSEHLFLLPGNLIRFLLSGKESFLRGFLLAFSKLPAVIRGRRKSKKAVVRDREIVEKYQKEMEKTIS